MLASENPVRHEEALSQCHEAYSQTAAEIIEKAVSRTLTRPMAERSLATFIECAAPETVILPRPDVEVFVAYLLNLAENDFVPTSELAGHVADLLCAPEDGFPRIR